MCTNIDTKTGIRYGVIHQAEVFQAWADSSEPVYGYYCPYCGNGPLKKGADAKRCPNCYHKIDPDNDFDYDYIDPVAYCYDEDGYLCDQSYDDTDIFILKSPYFTLCQLCSPCAPGSGYIMDEGTNEAYCFGHDWFDDGKAPYHVYRVTTGEEVLPE